MTLLYLSTFLRWIWTCGKPWLERRNSAEQMESIFLTREVSERPELVADI